MTGRRFQHVVAALAVALVAWGCASDAKATGMTWDFTKSNDTDEMGWAPDEDGLYTAELDDLTIKLPDGVVIDLEKIGRSANVSALRTLPSEVDPTLMEMTLEFPRLTLHEARRLAKRMARSYGLDPERFDGGLSGGSVFSGRYLEPPEGVSIEVTIRARNGDTYAVLIGISWP
jgi:hypothetical protein